MQDHGFIGDKLVDMRTNLRRAYSNPDDAPEESQQPSPHNVVATRSQEDERDRRNLEEMVARDLACIDTEISNHQSLIAELESIKSELQSISEAAESGEKLRSAIRRYRSVSGRLVAGLNRGAIIIREESNQRTEPSVWRSSFPMFIYMLIAALVVAIAIFATFVTF
ncbi:MAG: hypothetical protein MJ025_06755 [Victivallaceae bacterium]|nr:hypothetical protein [Victivallaceae bacterium]